MIPVVPLGTIERLTAASEPTADNRTAFADTAPVAEFVTRRLFTALVVVPTSTATNELVSTSSVAVPPATAVSNRVHAGTANEPVF